MKPPPREGAFELRWPDGPMTRSPDDQSSPLKKMNEKQNHRSPQRQQQPSPQTPSRMRDDADHPGNDRRPHRRQRKHDRSDAASGNAEALRKTGHGDRIQR